MGPNYPPLDAYNRRMRLVALCLLWVSIGVSWTPVFAQNPPPTLVINQQTAPPAYLGQKFTWRLTASGGTPPYTWQITSGRLPSKLSLDASSGMITGMPAEVGQYFISVAVTDSSSPPLEARSNFTITVTSPSNPSPLTLDWKQPPRIQGAAIQGSVEVANHADEAFDLTVIVLAVNEIGRATALGYQHFVMPSQGSQVIPFGATPGPGKYVIHADAVAEIARTDSIYRARKETKDPLNVPPQ